MDAPAPAPSASASAAATPSAAPSASAQAEPDAPSLSNDEINKRLLADGWTISAFTLDQRETGELTSNWELSKAPSSKGLVELHLYDQARDAAAKFREADGHVPNDMRIGRDGRVLLVVQVENNGTAASALMEALTSGDD